MHYGVAAAKQALADSGLEITDANREGRGAVFGSGGGEAAAHFIETCAVAHATAPAPASSRSSSPLGLSTDVGP